MPISTRRLEPDVRQALKDAPLFQYHLQKDILAHKVFPVLRDNRAEFYHGGRLFEFNEEGLFRTEPRLCAVLDVPWGDMVAEPELPGLKMITDFSSGYDTIKENCQVFTEREVHGITWLACAFSYVTPRTTCVLDVLVDLDNQNPRSADLVLFNTQTRELKLALVRHCANEELEMGEAQRSTLPEKIEFLRTTIREEWRSILEQYREYVRVANGLFGVHLPEPISIRPSAGLLIYGRQSTQAGIWARSEFLGGAPVLRTPRLDRLDPETLWDGL